MRNFVVAQRVDFLCPVVRQRGRRCYERKLKALPAAAQLCRALLVVAFTQSFMTFVFLGGSAIGDGRLMVSLPGL
jgi:hypothetical protein